MGSFLTFSEKNIPREKMLTRAGQLVQGPRYSTTGLELTIFFALNHACMSRKVRCATHFSHATLKTVIY